MISKCLFIFSICGEFEAIKNRALGKPATTAELNDIIKYIDNAKGEKSLHLATRIKVCFFSIRYKNKSVFEYRKFKDKWNIFWKNISFRMKIFV
jgi:hypothetical protein